MPNRSCEICEGKTQQAQRHCFSNESPGETQSKSACAYRVGSRISKGGTFSSIKDRYQDLLREFSQSIKTEKKELLHSHYLTTPLRTSQRPRSSRNP